MGRTEEMEERYPEVAGPGLVFVEGLTELRVVHDEEIVRIWDGQEYVTRLRAGPDLPREA